MEYVEEWLAEDETGLTEDQLLLINAMEIKENNLLMADNMHLKKALASLEMCAAASAQNVTKTSTVEVEPDRALHSSSEGCEEGESLQMKAEEHSVVALPSIFPPNLYVPTCSDENDMFSSVCDNPLLTLTLAELREIANGS